MPTVKIGEIDLGAGRPLGLIAGPCVLEDRDRVFGIAEKLVKVAGRLEIPFIFKSSYDKANRTSCGSPRGPGMEEGLRLLAAVRSYFECPVLSDVHEVAQVSAAAEVLDVLQIPALLCRQTDLIQSAARTGRAVNVKKGQFLAPWDMKNVVEKVEATGFQRLLLTERGTCFGYNALVSDFRALPVLRSFGYPVIFDGTHSVQMPGGQGTKSGGQREMVPYLLRAAAAVGCDALFVETHPDPDHAPSDGPNMIPIEDLEGILKNVLAIDAAARR
ncbi:MAG: 3-deoxy-8-phosphooctulonate synthase [Planctomycetes bacterium]|nr:3-deoxy-8-phosphooctulonate synthase [Planctomycetota bacterium]